MVSWNKAAAYDTVQLRDDRHALERAEVNREEHRIDWTTFDEQLVGRDELVKLERLRVGPDLA